MIYHGGSNVYRYLYIGLVTTVSTCILLTLIANWTTESPEKPSTSNAAPDETHSRGNDPGSTEFRSSRRHRVNWSLPIIYFVTPTYDRMERIADLTRLAQTLMHVPAIHWIVVEDSNVTDPEVTAVLWRSGVNYTQLALPPAFAPRVKRKRLHARGTANRLVALGWIRQRVTDGVLYFGDDDNTYDLRLFDEMRSVQKVAMWPVGLVTRFGVSSPVLGANGRVIGFYDGWVAGRKFPVDMASFAVNIKFMLTKKRVVMPFEAGHGETGFLTSLNISNSDIEPKAANCTKVFVWHTQTVANKRPIPWIKQTWDFYKDTNIVNLTNYLSVH